MINTLERLHSLLIFSIGMLPVFYLVEKHGLKGFFKLVIETFQLIA